MKRLCLFLAFVLCASPAFATLDVRSIWELNGAATAGNVNGGGFNPFVTTNNLTDLACTLANTSAPDCTSATYPFIAGDANHWLKIAPSGTFTLPVMLCKIASVAAGHAVLAAGIGACNVPSTSRWTTNTVVGVETAASPTGGTFTVDRSRSTALVQTTSTATNTAGVITVGGLTYDKSWIGNIVHISAGGTAGFYEIVDSTLNVSFTLDRDPTGTVNQAINLGGAISLGSSTGITDDAFFELATATNGTGSMHYFATGTFATFGVAVQTAAAGGTQAPIWLEGYATVRGDAPTGSTRPNFNAGNNIWTRGTDWKTTYLNVTGTTDPVIQTGASGQSIWEKCTNTSHTTATAGRNCFSAGANASIINLEAVSYLGQAAKGASNASWHGCYLHDSATGFLDSSTTVVDDVSYCLIAANSANGVSLSGAHTPVAAFKNMTVIGYPTPIASTSGFLFASGTTNVTIRDSIIWGFAAGVTHADTQTIGYDNYNDYFNNTANVSAVGQWQIGPNSITTNPTFTSVTQMINLGTVSSSTNVLTDTGADFTNLVNDVDFVNITGGSGTGFLNGIYPIHSHTATTLTLATPANGATNVTTSGAGTSITYQILVTGTTGRNFLPTVALAGFPGALPAGFTTGNMTMGATQRATSGGGSSGAFIIGGARR